MKKIEDAKRLKVRDIDAPFGNDFRKYLAEIITNSDDSYKRLENPEHPEYINKDSIKKIEIKIKKVKNKKENIGYEFKIIDQAEGFSIERINQIFNIRGADNSLGHNPGSRGIFGRGLFDVLKNSRYHGYEAKIETIKNDLPVRLKYILNENYDSYYESEQLQVSKNRLLQLRKNWGIEGNGTCVTFGINESRFEKKFKIDNVVAKLENFYTFRYIFSASNRKVKLSFQGYDYHLNSKRFLFDDADKVLDNFEFDIKHGNFITKANLNLYKSEFPSNDETKIIVTDNKNIVYANEFFKFDRYPSAKNIKGTLILDNIYEIAKYHLKIDEFKESADEVITQTRDGFNSKHAYFKALESSITPIIQKTIEENKETTSEKNLSKNKNFNEAIKEINKYIQKELEEDINGGKNTGIEPPPEGMRFIRTEIHINKEKKYNIKLLINPKLINSNQIIHIINDREEVEIKPKEFFYEEKEIADGIVYKNISIYAKSLTEQAFSIFASSEKIKAELLVNVIEKDIYYPKNGLEFHSSSMKVKNNSNHYANLYIDTNIVPVNSEIQLINLNKNIVTDSSRLVLDKNNIISNDIAIIKIKYETLSELGDYKISATFRNLKANLDIHIRDIEDPDLGTGGFINTFKIDEELKPFYQSYFNPIDKNIYIYQENIINKTLMPKLKEIHKDNYNLNQKKILADILSNQISILLVDKKIDKGRISIEIGGEFSSDKYRNELTKEKNKIFQLMYNILTKKK